jgi:hypothetical protein
MWAYLNRNYPFSVSLIDVGPHDNHSLLYILTAMRLAKARSVPLLHVLGETW